MFKFGKLNTYTLQCCKYDQIYFSCGDTCNRKTHFSPSHDSYIAVYIKKQFRHVLLQKVGPAAFAVACL